MPLQGLTKNVPKYFKYIVSVHTLTITFELIKASYSTVEVLQKSVIDHLL